MYGIYSQKCFNILMPIICKPDETVTIGPHKGNGLIDNSPTRQRKAVKPWSVFTSNERE